MYMKQSQLTILTVPPYKKDVLLNIAKLIFECKIETVATKHLADV